MPQLPDELRGCKIFPCIAGTKLPATPNGWKDATDDPAQIAEWERALPGCNWAVATGLSNLFVIDVDPEGLAAWEQMQNVAENTALLDAVQRTFTVHTPRAGWHVYFRGVGPSTASRIAPGIDTRGGIRLDDGSIESGGYVLLPGSRTRDGVYTALRDRDELLDLPSAITQLIPERKKAETHGLEKNPDLDQPRNVRWATELLKGYVASGRISEQGKGGNNTAFQVAASVLDKAISPGTAYDLLWEHWNPHCSPPWDDWELERVVANAAAYGEDTGKGAKGILSNADAFAGFTAQVTPEPSRPRSRLMWLHDYAESVQDPTWLIPGILPAQGTGMIYGASGAYKSFLSLDMALSLAYGIAGQWGAPPVRNDVLFLAGEGPIATVKKRWPAWLEWQEIDEIEQHRMAMKDRVPFYSDSESWEQIKIDLADLDARPSLIVIDTLSRFLTGMDENNTKEATMAVSFLEELARYYECFVLAVHHTGKDEKRGARGSSVFHANMDVVLSARKTTDGTELRVRKQKDADVPDEPHYFKSKKVLDSIVLERCDAPAEAPRAGKPRTEWTTPGYISGLLHNHGGEMNMSHLAQEIANITGVDIMTVQRRLRGTSELNEFHPHGLNVWMLPASVFDI